MITKTTPKLTPQLRSISGTTALILAAAAALLLSACEKKVEGSGAPPPAQVIPVQDMSMIAVDQKELSKFPLVTAEKTELTSELTATGAVFPDVSREVPVISLANGRVVDIKARLDDNVKKDQLLFQVQSPDISTAFNAYLKAVNDEQLANKADLRAEDLFKHGAISQAMVEQADTAERDAKADLLAAEEQLKIFGVDKDHPNSVVNVYAPISGVIIGQNVTNAAAAGVTLSGSATAFTIADLTTVWILCDVYEHDIPRIKIGQEARIKPTAYPDRLIKGTITDIGPVLDPQLRTAKVRVQITNPGYLKLGMFVTATFTDRRTETHAVVPSEAVLHLHDRDWVFVPAGGDNFRRVEVQAGRILDGKRQVILSGVEPGQQLVGNALMLETAGTQ
jgi:cobalt-zinc-cadmium efflux system membrane fusion protein